MKAPERVHICEVGLRDGLQLVDTFVPTDEKVRIADRLSDCGFARIQVTSFVHPKVMPQLADGATVMRDIKRRPGTVYSGLVPNVRGAQRAIEAGVDAIDTVVSASESHNLANVNMTVDESLQALAGIVQLANSERLPVLAAISTAFGCPFEGRTPLPQLERIVGELARIGVRGVQLADTTGMANPLQVAQTFEHLMPRFPELEWHLHTHDTRALAIANILAAMECGVTHFDASVGGLGGCPFAPGASGNACTEDLVHGLHAMNVDTGVDLTQLIDTARYASTVIDAAFPGQIIKAGPWDRHYDPPANVQERLARV